MQEVHGSILRFFMKCIVGIQLFPLPLEAQSSTPKSPTAHSSSALCTSPSPPPKRIKVDKEPEWITQYRSQLQEMHKERMAVDRKRIDLDARRVASLEKLIDIISKKE
ncbi:hypothetical protein FSP39_023144 [Pinctada imbricata]|uniref:Uncharacterized protein n=1 Tax=Pinctada imbricata TaxID=66713 RepID=A0AA89BTJ0_PINIB|nr:hypothetical protein FSP39_023144 [Pinctada imbricata]